MDVGRILAKALRDATPCRAFTNRDRLLHAGFFSNFLALFCILDFTMMLEKLDSAIRELNEAKRLAQLFGWPESVVKRIDLVRRGAIHYRKQIETEVHANDGGKFAETSTAVQ